MQKNNNTRLRSMVLTGLFSAFVATATMIAVPMATGYVNAGDIIILLGAFTLSPIQAILSAAIGSSIADLINGYAVYIPATFIIKGCMALCAHYILRALTKISVTDKISTVIASLASELVMAIGYTAYEWTVLGYGAAALGGMVGNLIQASFGIVGGVSLYFILKHTNLKSKLFAI